MPLLNFPECELDLPRNLALLDTNVLVAFVDDRDNDHEQAAFVLEELDSHSLVAPIPVIVEAFGLLTSRRGLSKAMSLVRWLSTPGQVSLLPALNIATHEFPTFMRRAEWMAQFSVDYVDSHLMETAHALTERCGLKPHAPIFTFDTRDFLRCATRGRNYSIFDMRELELIAFG